MSYVSPSVALKCIKNNDTQITRYEAKNGTRVNEKINK